MYFRYNGEVVDSLTWLYTCTSTFQTAVKLKVMTIELSYHVNKAKELPFIDSHSKFVCISLLGKIAM